MYKDLIDRAMAFMERRDFVNIDPAKKRHVLETLVENAVVRTFEGMQALGFNATVPSGCQYEIVAVPQVRWKGLELVIVDRTGNFMVDDIQVGNRSVTPAATTVSALAYASRQGVRRCNVDMPWADWNHPIKLRIRNISPCAEDFKATMFGIVEKDTRFVLGGRPYIPTMDGPLELRAYVDERQLSLLETKTTKRCYGCDKGAVEDGGRLCVQCKKDSEKG